MESLLSLPPQITPYENCRVKDLASRAERMKTTAFHGAERTISFHPDSLPSVRHSHRVTQSGFVCADMGAHKSRRIREWVAGRTDGAADQA